MTCGIHRMTGTGRSGTGRAAQGEGSAAPGVYGEEIQLAGKIKI